MIMIAGYFGSGRYERFQRVTILSGEQARIGFFGYDLAAGGVSRKLLLSRYHLLVDGVERAAADISAETSSGEFILDLRTLSEGWHELDVVGHATESCPQWPVYVKKGASANLQQRMPVTTGSYGLLNGPSGAGYNHLIASVPAVFSPTLLPLKLRDYPALESAADRPLLVQTQWAPTRIHDIHRPNLTPDGLMTTCNTQAYFWSDFTAKLPKVALLDGPRGAGTVVMATHLQIGRLGGVYFCDPWRVGKVEPDGTVRTLAGYRHNSPPTFWGAAPALQLVGDWSAVVPERRGFHELWGLAWDPSSLSTNDSAAPIGGEQPHLRGPRAFVADTQNNRICLLEFAPDSRDTPARVREFITGLQDPWDVVCDEKALYVSERTGHRISAFDLVTGKHLRVVASGADLSGVNPNRFVIRKAPLDRIRVEACVGPEGLFHQDGWLYFGSRAMGQVRRINLTTGEMQVVTPLALDDNSNFVKLSVSDGSFGPRGTVFVATWSNAYYGFPTAYLPGGKQWDYLWGGSFGPPWDLPGYATGVSAMKGRLACASSQEGLFVFSRPLASDPVASPRASAGAREWQIRGFHLTHGPNGFGYHGLSLPWGASSDIDAFLAAHGHSRV